MNTTLRTIYLCLLLTGLTFNGLAAALPPGVLRVDGVPAPVLKLANLDGEDYDLANSRGHWIFVHFWASWCGPCREEMPELSTLHTEYKDKNVVVLGIALDEMGAIKAFAAETPVSYPLFSAEEYGGELAANLGNDKSALPYTVIIKPDGTIANTYFGRISKVLLEETLLKLLP